jgi:uncharacterized protein (DUF1778 family)
MPRKQTKIERETPNRVERLGFRLDEETKDLIERAAHLSRRTLVNPPEPSERLVRALAEHKRRVAS